MYENDDIKYNLANNANNDQGRNYIKNTIIS